MLNWGHTGGNGKGITKGCGSVGWQGGKPKRMNETEQGENNFQSLSNLRTSPRELTSEDGKKEGKKRRESRQQQKKKNVGGYGCRKSEKKGGQFSQKKRWGRSDSEKLAQGSNGWGGSKKGSERTEIG